MISKADWKYWDKASRDDDPHVAPKSETIRRWIEHFCAKRPPGTCLEIGCYPGRFLAIFGEMGYELYGVDLTERIETLSTWMKAKNYRVGRLWHEDFFEFKPGRKFDVVLSLGFIEHFTDWEAVLDQHMNLVGPDGFLVLSVPNFLGSFQNRLHRSLDGENYQRHHIPAMNVEEWVKRLDRHQFKLIYSGYFGPFDFWVGDQQRTLVQRTSLKLLTVTRPFLRHLLPRDKQSYSPYAGLIAERL